MYIAQQSLLAHLRTGFPAYTIEEYAGQLKEPTEVNLILPATLVMFNHAKPSKFRGKTAYNFRLLCLEQSRCLDETDSVNKNLQFASSIADWLIDNDKWMRSDSQEGHYIIDHDETEATLMLQSETLTVISIGLSIKFLT